MKGAGGVRNEVPGLREGRFGKSTVTQLRAEGAAGFTGLTKALPCGHGEPWKVLELGRTGRLS